MDLDEILNMRYIIKHSLFSYFESHQSIVVATRERKKFFQQSTFNLGHIALSLFHVHKHECPVIMNVHICDRLYIFHMSSRRCLVAMIAY
jgi:hypothetical protein